MLQPHAKDFTSTTYAQYPIMTTCKQNFSIFCKFIKEEKLKYHIDISIEAPSAATPTLSLIGQDVTGFAPGSVDILPFFSGDSLELHRVGWGLSVH